MKVSGFTFVRNALTLDFPIVEAITSVLPICDEFVVAAGDSNDGTTDVIRRIGDQRIRLIETVWDPSYFIRGAIYAQQTNLALAECSGDWCFYLQADEVVHEADLPIIRRCMEANLRQEEVEGLLFRYLHFWGDYRHYHRAHCWYDKEIRVIRNGLGIQSWHDAQGFRRNSEKLRAVDSKTAVYHYGYVRHPMTMSKKQHIMDAVYRAAGRDTEHSPAEDIPFDYYPLDHLPIFKGTHPQVMQARIAQKNWDAADYRGSGHPKQHKHNRPSQRLLSFVENRILGGKKLWDNKNYIELR